MLLHTTTLDAFGSSNHCASVYGKISSTVTRNLCWIIIAVPVSNFYCTGIWDNSYS